MIVGSSYVLCTFNAFLFITYLFFVLRVSGQIVSRQLPPLPLGHLAMTVSMFPAPPVVCGGGLRESVRSRGILSVSSSLVKTVRGRILERLRIIDLHRSLQGESLYEAPF